MYGLQLLVQRAALCGQDSGCPDALEYCRVCSSETPTKPVYTSCLVAGGCSKQNLRKKAAVSSVTPRHFIGFDEIGRSEAVSGPACIC
jgi:hypothetical protein